MSIVESKNIKYSIADSAWIKARRMTSTVRQTKRPEHVDNLWQDGIKAKVSTWLYLQVGSSNVERTTASDYASTTTKHRCIPAKTNVLSAEKISVLSCYFPVRYSNHIGEEISCHLWYASVEIPGKCVDRRLIRA
ncbi:hypothetical protein Tco_0117067 [Tanacetum coccineum]